MLLNMEFVKKFVEDAVGLIGEGKTETEIAEALDIPKNMKGNPSVLYLRQFMSTAKNYIRGRINPDIIQVADENTDVIVRAFKERTVARLLGGKKSMLRLAAPVAWLADYLNSHYTA